MIPKKIHYCWLSEDEMPEKLQMCMESWKRFLPDYEMVKWDLKRFPLDKNEWVRQAFERKKYAFAADYIRLYALATEGGIYLDSDVEVLKSFDDLLSLPYFVCKENSPQGVEAAILGAEKGTPWIVKSLDYYNNRSFVNEKGVTQTKVLPAVLTGVIDESFTAKYIESPSDFDATSGMVNILPSDYFSPKNYVTKKIVITRNSYCIHHFAGSWQPLWKRMLLYVWVPFSVMFPGVAKWIKGKK